MEVNALTTVRNSCSPVTLEKICFPNVQFTYFKWHCGKKARSFEPQFLFRKQRQILLDFFFFFQRDSSYYSQTVFREMSVEDWPTKSFLMFN